MKSEKTIVRGLVVLMSLMWLIGLTVSCSNDEETANGQTEAPEVPVGDAPVAEVRSFVTFFDEYIAQTRAWSPPSGFAAYENGDQPIGIAFTNDGEDPIIGTFYKSGGKWHFNVADPSKSVEDITGGTYYLYGYIPNIDIKNLSVTDLEGNKAKFSEGAKVVLTNMPNALGKDLCVVIGAKEGQDADHDKGLRQGDFSYRATAIEKNSGEPDGNYVFLLFDHLYAALSIYMKVDADYANLRTIKLKRLELSTMKGESATSQKTTITIDLKATEDGSVSPIQSITYTPQGGSAGSGHEFWSSAAGEELETDYNSAPFTGYFMPDDITTLVLTSEYDVYDKETPEPNLIRKGCKATNTLVLRDLMGPYFSGTERGYKYTLRMTIQPTYLYVLSDPDLDNPTVTVE